VRAAHSLPWDLLFVETSLRDPFGAGVSTYWRRQASRLTARGMDARLRGHDRKGLFCLKPVSLLKQPLDQTLGFFFQVVTEVVLDSIRIEAWLRIVERSAD